MALRAQYDPGFSLYLKILITSAKSLFPKMSHLHLPGIDVDVFVGEGRQHFSA